MMSESDVSDCPLYVTLRVPDQSVIEHIIGLYNNADAEVETIAISNPCSKGAQPVVVDLGNVTKNQWETLEIAYDLGHYSGTRGGNLEKIANQLDITKSAASQRLRSAESRIIEGVMGTGKLSCGGSDDEETQHMHDISIESVE